MIFPGGQVRTEVVLTYNGACKKKESEIVSEQSMVNKNKVGNCLNNIFFIFGVKN